MTAAAPLVTTASGQLRGAATDGIALFRGVPYAAPPLGPLRFAPTKSHPGWSGVRDATREGPCPPQLPTRLERVIGRVDFAQDEDCLTLTIAAPAPIDAAARRPVLVWFHGGAWMSGAGSFSCYSGNAFARNGAVFVGVNHRLGILGYLAVPELEGSGSGANFGLLDHVAALRWVRDNIAAFGGDPANVTVFGQSAGGGSIATLMSMPEAVPLFRRAILQSAAIMPHASPDSARRVCDEVLKALGLERGRIAALREIPVAKILDAQRIAMMALARPGDATPPYRMVRDGAALKRDPLDAVAAGSAAGKDILIGTTRDEMHAFFAGNEQLTALGRAGIVDLLRKQSGDAAEQTFNAYATRSPGQSPVEIFSAIRTDTFFRLPSLRFAEAQGRHASTTYVYRFDWRPVRDAPFGAAHCIELPFVFDNLADWDAAAVPPAMLKGGDRRVMAKLADAMQKAWVAFAAGGNPNHPGLPRWQPYSATRRHSMVFDAECRAVENLDDASDTTRTA